MAMKSSRLRPKVVIWWGIALAVGGSLLGVFAPGLMYQWYGGADAAGQGFQGIDQGLLSIIQVVVSLATNVCPSVGAALIGAGVVMRYVKNNATRDFEHSFQLGRRADPQ
jgi:predicted lipid-binding transport protein (Tim44 family)